MKNTAIETVKVIADEFARSIVILAADGRRFQHDHLFASYDEINSERLAMRVRAAGSVEALNLDHWRELESYGYTEQRYN